MLGFSRSSHRMLSTVVFCSHQNVFQEAARVCNLRRKGITVSKNLSNFFCRTISYRQLHFEKAEGQVAHLSNNESSPLGYTFKQRKNVITWTQEMDKNLLDIANKEVSLTWKELSAKYFPHLTAEQLRSRYYSISPFNKHMWSEEEVSLLKWAVLAVGEDWRKVSKAVGTRNSRQCYAKWEILIDPELGKTPWTEEESEHLVQLVLEPSEIKNQNGAPVYSHIDWEKISASFPGKTAKRCQIHFMNQSDNLTRKKHNLGSISYKPWSSQESSLLHSLVYMHKFNWLIISKELKTRLPRQCRKHWYDLEMKRLESKT